MPVVTTPIAEATIKPQSTRLKFLPFIVMDKYAQSDIQVYS